MLFTWRINQLPQHGPCVVAIGNFDGVHLGHQTLLQKLLSKASKLKLPAVVIIFEPQPTEYLAPQTAPPRLTRLRQKLALFTSLGIEQVACLRFNAVLEGLTPEEFVRQILVEKLAAKYLFIGDDFRFGKDRSGDYALLTKLGRQYGFSIKKIDKYTKDNQRISSTRIRAALQKGDLALATTLLGRPYILSGRVAHGEKRGRKMGFPTANLRLHRQQAPITGIFAVHVLGLRTEPIAAIAYIGKCPVFAGQEFLLEVYLLNFADDIYGRYIQVEILALLRKEEINNGVQSLQLEMQQDLKKAQAFFNAKKAQAFFNAL